MTADRVMTSMSLLHNYNKNSMPLDKSRNQLGREVGLQDSWLFKTWVLSEVSSKGYLVINRQMVVVGITHNVTGLHMPS